MSAAPSKRHQRVSKRLFLRLYHELEESGLAEVFYAPYDVIAASDRVMQPDLLVVDAKRDAILEERGVIGAPDTVIEVISPSTRKHDQVRKRRFYARIGVREYWIVDPYAETIEVLELIEAGLSYRQAGWYAGGDRARSVVFAFEIDVDALFANLDD